MLHLRPVALQEALLRVPEVAALDLPRIFRRVGVVQSRCDALRRKVGHGLEARGGGSHHHDARVEPACRRCRRIRAHPGNGVARLRREGVGWEACHLVDVGAEYDVDVEQHDPRPLGLTPHGKPRPRRVANLHTRSISPLERQSQPLRTKLARDGHDWSERADACTESADQLHRRRRELGAVEYDNWQRGAMTHELLHKHCCLRPHVAVDDHADGSGRGPLFHHGLNQWFDSRPC
eukprot:scaffold43088_cov64-Phaeocystis_antarctica.AAC.7